MLHRPHTRASPRARQGSVSHSSLMVLHFLDGCLIVRCSESCSAQYRQACEMCRALGPSGEAKLQEVLALYARLAHRLNRNVEALHLYEELVTLVTKLKDGAPCAELGKHTQCILFRCRCFLGRSLTRSSPGRFGAARRQGATTDGLA